MSETQQVSCDKKKDGTTQSDEIDVSNNKLDISKSIIKDMHIGECIFKDRKVYYPAKNQIFHLPGFMNSDDCDYFIDIIDNNVNYIEKWGKQSNVCCQFIEVDKIPGTEQEPNLRKVVDDRIYKNVGEFIRKLKRDYDIHCSGDSGYCLRKIYGPTRLHVDGINVEKIDNRYIPIRKVRKMSVIIALNEDYDEGTFHFPYQDYSIKLKKGDLIAFPPYWTHLHGVDSPANGTVRYTINTWLFE
jgi:hypothetical protein